MLRRMRRLRLAALAPLFSVALMAMSYVVVAPRVTPRVGPHCYLLGGRHHVLTWAALDDFDPRTNETTIGPTFMVKADAMTFQTHSGVLFGVDSHMPQFAAYLGTFDLATGAFQPRPSPIGPGQGALGELRFHDISGLAFDPVTGWLYAVQIETGVGVPDALLRLDPATGRLVPGAFDGADYALLRPMPAYPHLWDVDDLAFDPAGGQLYGIVNNSHDGDRLVQIDKMTGALTDVGAFGPGEVEGLDFDAHGRLWATAGGDRDLPNHLYEVDPLTGRAFNPRPLDNSSNYEALACHAAAPDLALSLAGREPAAAADGLQIYTLRYANHGSGPAHGVTLTQTLPANARFAAAFSSPGWQPVAGVPGVYRLDLGALLPGQRGLANFAARVHPGLGAASDELSAAAEIGGALDTGVDLNPRDNRAVWQPAP